MRRFLRRFRPAIIVLLALWMSQMGCAFFGYWPHPNEFMLDVGDEPFFAHEGQYPIQAVGVTDKQLWMDKRPDFKPNMHVHKSKHVRMKLQQPYGPKILTVRVYDVVAWEGDRYFLGDSKTIPANTGGGYHFGATNEGNKYLVVEVVFAENRFRKRTALDEDLPKDQYRVYLMVHLAYYDRSAYIRKYDHSRR